jgi:hypothetical protein
MYNVDVYNNTLFYTIIINNPASLTPNRSWCFLQIVPCNSFVNLFNDVEEQHYIGSDTQLTSYIGTVTEKMIFYLMYIQLLIQQKFYKNKTNYWRILFFSFNNLEYCIKYNTENQPVIDILIKGEFSIAFNEDKSITIIYFTLYNIDLTTYKPVGDNSFIIAINNLKCTLAVEIIIF